MLMCNFKINLNASLATHRGAGEVPDDFALLTGDDPTTMPFMAQGGDGCISVVSNVAPKAMVEMLAAVASGDLERAAQLHLKLAPLSEALFCKSNPIPVKTACAWLGLIPTCELRLPLTPLSTGGQGQLEQVLTSLGLRPVVGEAPSSTLGPGAVPIRENAEARTVEYEMSDGGKANP